MLIFDQLKKSDPQLRMLALAILAGLGLLLGGLWWVQVVSARDYRESLETQSFRTVRIPAVRGKIVDRNGSILAENRPAYGVSLYLEELRKPIDRAYFQEVSQARAELARQMEEKKKLLNRPLTKHEKREFVLGTTRKAELRTKARYQVASNVVSQISQHLQQPLTLDPKDFERHYQTRLALPYPVLPNLDPALIARFQEQLTSPLGVDLQVESVRVYPWDTLAAHVLGSLRRDNSSAEGEESFFSYRLPDFRGALGIEFGYDKELRGTAGAKSVLVNNVGYRQTENVWSPAEPGHNVVLTLDLELQRAAEQALQSAPVLYPAPVRGAVVVMDVSTGDVLAMASSPTLNPNSYVKGFTRQEWQRISDLHAQKNRATQENYAPGSIFKTVHGLALLESGLNPQAKLEVPANPAQPNRGYIKVGRRVVRDTAPPGDYNFRRALYLSSNTYFISNGLKFGVEKTVRLGQRFHLGERMGLPLRQETEGSFPTLARLSSGWTDGNTANLSIGQDPVLVTPMQVAVMTSAIANGGKVLWPRLVDRIVPSDPTSDEKPVAMPRARVRDELGVSARSMSILHEAMLADTEDPEGTGKKAAVPGLRICGKTGTAQVQDEENVKTGQTTWFTSFAPYEKPRYAVVVMVEDGKSGGETCAWVAGQIYAQIVKMEQRGTRPGSARNLAAAARPD